MKYMLGALLLASGLAIGAASTSAAPAVDIRATTPQSIVEKAQSERTCRRWRHECRRHGDRGDCRRYRRLCDRWWR
jgi:hypothetical protein